MNLSVSMIYAMYISNFKPYKGREYNRLLLCNEICYILMIYTLIWLSITKEFDLSEVDNLEKCGWIYITITSISFVGNFLFLSYKVLIDIPMFYRKSRLMFRVCQYLWWKRGYHQVKNVKGSKGGWISKYF